MESSDDEGEPAAAFAKPALFLFIFLFASYHPCRHAFQKSAPGTATATAAPPSRPVAVQKKKSKKKKVYLTFDDGPNRGTGNVLHIARDEQVPVTFFIVGEHVFASKGQHGMWDSLRMAEHIALCNHSFTHANNRYHSFYEDPEGVVEDFQRTHDTLGLTNTIVRTPGRNIWRIDSLRFTDLKQSAAAADSLQNAGFMVMGWDLEWHFDHKSLSVKNTACEVLDCIDSLFRHNKTRCPDHLVILAHDQAYAKSPDSFQLRQFLQLLKQREEYEISLATDYPMVRSEK